MPIGWLALPWWAPAPACGWRPTILDQLHYDFHGATAFIVEHSYHPATSAAEKARYLDFLRENDPQVLYGDFVASNAFDVLSQVASLELPTLILCGEQDQMTPPKYSQALHERIAGSELHLVEQAGHNVIVEQPEVVAAHFARFLATGRDRRLTRTRYCVLRSIP